MTCALSLVPALNWHRRHRRLLRWLVALALLATAVALFADTLGGAAAAFGRLDVTWAAVAVLFELGAVAATAALQRRMLRVGGVLMPAVRAYRLALATTALNLTMPAGNAVSTAFAFSRLRSWNVGAALAGFSVAGSAGLSLVGFTLLSVSFGLAQHESVGATLATAGVALLLAALVLLVVLVQRRHPDRLAAVARRAWGRVNRLRRREASAGLAAVDTFFHDLHLVHPRRRDWLIGSTAAGVYWLADLACLLACQRALGMHDVGLVVTAGAYLAGMGVAGLSPVPGGLGAVEAAMIVVLAQGDVGHVAAAGLVIVYRAMSLGLVGALGWAEVLLTRLTARRAVVTA